MAVEGLSGGDTAVLDEAPVTSDWPVSARTPTRPADARARLFVWGSWTAMFGSTLGLVLARKSMERICATACTASAVAGLRETRCSRNKGR